VTLIFDLCASQLGHMTGRSCWTCSCFEV